MHGRHQGLRQWTHFSDFYAFNCFIKIIIDWLISCNKPLRKIFTVNVFSHLLLRIAKPANKAVGMTALSHFMVVTNGFLSLILPLEPFVSCFSFNNLIIPNVIHPQFWMTATIGLLTWIRSWPGTSCEIETKDLNYQLILNQYSVKIQSSGK